MKQMAYILILLVVASTAIAQVDLTPTDIKTHFIYLHGGIAAPIGELSDRAKLGVSGGAGYGASPFGAEFPDFETIVRAQGHYFPSNPNRGTITILTAGLDLKIRQRPPRRSFGYILLGGGFSRAAEAAHQVIIVDQDVSTTINRPQRVESKYYLNAAIGVEYVVLGSSRIFFEARVTDASGDVIRDYMFFNATMGIGF